MKLKDLLETVDYKTKKDFEVKKITLDSREVENGSLYICFNQEYLTKDLLKKDIIVLTNFKCSNKKIIYFANLKNDYDKIIHFFYDNVSEKVVVVGITGTNGKTTIAYSLYNLFNMLGHKSMYIGTLGAFYDNVEVLLKNTTPSLVEILSLIKEGKEKGVEYVFIEVSSHALSQDRVKGINFKGAIFTNLTQDHLDYHQNMENYAICKKKLFDNLSEDSFAIINKDDQYHKLMIEDCKAKIYYYGFLENKVSKLKYHHHISFLFEGGKLSSSLIGKFNVYNLLATYYTAICLNQKQKEVLKKISALPNVNGRMDLIKYHHNYIIVDFAHTPDAFSKVLEEASQLKHKKLKVLFGCGGNRDKGKRSLMGSIASSYADVIYLTNDNTRDEDEKEIAKDIEKGIKNCQVIKEYDRKKAIELALSSLKKGEILLILGRGHETVLTINNQKIPLNDKDTVKEWIKEH